MALAAYRHLLRSTRIAFQGDLPTFQAARRAARDAFHQNAALAPAGKEALDAVQHAEDVATILKMNVVQGRAVEGEGDKFKLRIHEHTERGDNDTVKFAGRQGKKLAELKCGCS